METKLKTQIKFQFIYGILFDCIWFIFVFIAFKYSISFNWIAHPFHIDFIWSFIIIHFNWLISMKNQKQKKNLMLIVRNYNSFVLYHYYFSITFNLYVFKCGKFIDCSLFYNVRLRPYPLKNDVTREIDWLKYISTQIRKKKNIRPNVSSIVFKTDDLFIHSFYCYFPPFLIPNC